MNEKYPGINIDEKGFREKSEEFKKLILKLQRCVEDYNAKIPTRFGACLMSKGDLAEWQQINEIDKKVFFKPIERFWNFSIAMTDGLSLIPLEDVL